MIVAMKRVNPVHLAALWVINVSDWIEMDRETKHTVWRLGERT